MNEIKSIPQRDVLPEFLVVRSPENLGMIRKFTAQKYAFVYGANLQSFLPQAICYLDKRERIRAASGFQSADRPLFLEQYLSEPIEHVLAQKFQMPIPQRSQIVELGNFAASTPGATRQFILRLGKYLLRSDFVGSY